MQSVNVFTASQAANLNKCDERDKRPMYGERPPTPIGAFARGSFEYNMLEQQATDFHLLFIKKNAFAVLITSCLFI